MWPGPRGNHHSPQAICGSTMVSRLCLTPKVLTQQFPPASRNMKCRVQPDSFSQRLPRSACVTHPHFSNSKVGRGMGERKSYVRLDFCTVSLRYVFFFFLQRRAVIKVGNSRPTRRNNMLRRSVLRSRVVKKQTQRVKKKKLAPWRHSWMVSRAAT